VIIGQSRSLNSLNVVIKLKSDLSPSQRQQVLNSLSANSLCRDGCPNKQKIGLVDLLEAAGVDTRPPGVEAPEHKKRSRSGSGGDSSDSCSDLLGYYRFSCLFLKLMGLKEPDEGSRFAQSYDNPRTVNASLAFLESREPVSKAVNSSSSCLRLWPQTHPSVILSIALFISILSHSSHS